MNKFIISLPIVITLIISFFLLIFLLQNKDPSKPPSSLINEALPNFEISNLYDENQNISKKELKDKITIINFFASWCAPCRAEHPLLFEIKKQHPNLFILGINMQDKTDKAKKFLEIDGNPYDYVGIDEFGLVAIEFGVIGLPETFLIDSSGKIIYKYQGPLTKEIVKNEIKPLL